MRVKCLIVNADDFGQEGHINRAVLESLQRGLCSSASLMATMPGFEEACQIVHENRWVDRIGLHLVLSGGTPLTDSIKCFPRFCDKEGQLWLSRKVNTVPILRLENSEKEALAQEIRAQIKRCRDHGIPLTHVDSHYHLHNEWAILSVLIPILHDEQVRSVRIARNCGNGLSLPKRVYKFFLNGIIRRARLDRTQYCGSIEDYMHLLKGLPPEAVIESFEVVTHPKLSEDGKTLRDDDTKNPFVEVMQGMKDG